MPHGGPQTPPSKIKLRYRVPYSSSGRVGAEPNPTNRFNEQTIGMPREKVGEAGKMPYV
jgi:hypothetical protein